MKLKRKKAKLGNILVKVLIGLLILTVLGVAVYYFLTAEDEDNSFWFSSDMPDALNDLPDLEVAPDNFFGDSNISDLSFPDLKLDFAPNDTEEK